MRGKLPTVVCRVACQWWTRASSVCCCCAKTSRSSKLTDQDLFYREVGEGWGLEVGEG